MYHPELGMTTFQIAEQERLARLAEEQERNAKLTEAAALLRALERKRQEDDDATQDMIEEGGPVRDDNQGENDD